MTDIGHNGGPKLQRLTAKHKIERIQKVLDMDISGTSKLIGIRIIADADSDGITPELSTEDLKRSASVKDRVTVYRATQKLEEKKVAKTVKEDGRPNRYLVLPSEAIDAVLDEIDATSGISSQGGDAVKPQCDETTLVGSDHTQPVRPDRTTQYDQTPPVGLEPTGSNRTGEVEPHGLQAEPSRARANIENPTGLLFHEEEEEENKIRNSPEQPKRAKPRPKPTTEQFERFWSAYPLRKGKEKALERFLALTPEDAEQAIYGAERYATECKQKGTENTYVKWAQGWLNERRFKDYAPSAEHDKPKPPAAPNWWRANPEAARKVASETFWRDAIKYANGHWPVEYLGPPPGDPGCLLPPTLKAEMAKLYDKHGVKRS